MAQRGMSLMFSLLALVALSLAAVALIRSVDTGTIVLGNLGFKQDATATADIGTQEALNWLSTATSLTADNAAAGYYATSNGNPTSPTLPVDVTGQLNPAGGRMLIKWDDDGDATDEASDCAYASGTIGTACTIKPVSRNNGARMYVIFRLCKTAGEINLAGNSCAQPGAGAGGAAAARGALDYSSPAPFKGTPGAYYRIVVRSQGARNTTSFTETIVQF